MRALYRKWQDNNDGRFDVCERATGAIALRYCLRKYQGRDHEPDATIQSRDTIVVTPDVERIVTAAFVASRANDRDRARELFAEAARRGSAESHYQLARRTTSHEEQRLHYSTAALAGHGDAMRDALDLLFYNPQGEQADPMAALQLYLEATDLNPDLSIESRYGGSR